MVTGPFCVSGHGVRVGVVLVGLSWAGSAGAAEVSVETCVELSTALTDYCRGGNTLVISSGLDCDLSFVSASGDCTITTDSPCGASITNSATYPAIFTGSGSVTFDGLSLSCDAGYSTSYLIAPGSGTTTFTNACLDGSSCGVALVGGASSTDSPGVLGMDRSLLVGPVVALPAGAGALTVTNSIISVQDIEREEDEPPASVLYGVDVDQVELSLSAVLASGDLVSAVTLSGASEINLHNNAVFSSGAAPALDLSDATVQAHHNTLFSDGSSGAALKLDASTLSLARNLFFGFSTAILDTDSTVSSDQDVWVNVSTAGGGLTVSSLTASEAGVTAHADGEAFCFLPPPCETPGCMETYELCLEDAKLWPADGCSALVLTTGGGAYDDLVGMVGGLDALSEAAPDSPPWVGFIGDSDGDGLADSDGDGWVDDLDWAPLDGASYKPSWYRITGDTCVYADNTCEADRPEGYTWTEYALGTEPAECPTRDTGTPDVGDDTGGGDSGAEDSGHDTGEPDGVMVVGTGCGRVKIATLLLPALFILSRPRRWTRS